MNDNNWTHNKEYLKILSKKALERNAQIYQERLQKYDKDPKLCKQCGRPLTYKQFKQGNNFCNRSCSANWNNNLRNTTAKNREENRICMNCGKTILKKKKDTWQDYNRRMFCSSECKWESKQKEYIEKWKKGSIDGMSGDDVSDIIRKYLLKKVGNKCEKCGWSEINPFTNRIPLELHHIDGNPYNNVEENLVVLCPNCHSLTRTFKGNRGKGRYVRKINYYKRKEELKRIGAK